MAGVSVASCGQLAREDAHFIRCSLAATCCGVVPLSMILNSASRIPWACSRMSPWPNLQSCARVVTKARTPRKTREGERGDAQEGIVLLDEEDALDREGSVGVDDEGRVLEVRDQERQNREELILGELRAAAGGAVVSELLFPARSTRREPTLPACGT